MPGSAFPTLTTFAFAEKPLSSSKLNELINALNALKTWTGAGDILYGYDADQLEKLVKPASPGMLWMNASGVPAWLTGTAGYVPRWNGAGQPTAYPWLSFNYHSDTTGHSYGTAAWRDMPNSSKDVTLAAQSTIIVIGCVGEYQTGTCSFYWKYNIDGTDIDWAQAGRTYDNNQINTIPNIGMLTGVAAGTRTIKIKETAPFSATYNVTGLWYLILVIPE